jgi:hypothetical protein
MRGQKQFTDKVVERFRLSERVPRRNLYRRLDEVLDLSFLHEEAQPLYRHMGQPSLDPVVFFRLRLMGRLENIASDSRLLTNSALRLDSLLFLLRVGRRVALAHDREPHSPTLPRQLIQADLHLCGA